MHRFILFFLRLLTNKLFVTIVQAFPGQSAAVGTIGGGNGGGAHFVSPSSSASYAGSISGGVSMGAGSSSVSVASVPGSRVGVSATGASVVSLVQSGIPGIQYTYVDPDTQFQKYLIVLVQAPSGTDPLAPPDYNARITDQGKFLELTIPVCAELGNADLLVHKQASWMQEGGARKYENRKQVRLGGLGPAIAVANTHFRGQPWCMVWKIPLSQVCDEIIGNYSITNFPANPNMAGQKHYPVVIEFKLKTNEQTVKRHAEVNAGVWQSDDEEENHSSKRARSEP